MMLYRNVLNFLRGTGLTGLGGIPPKRDFLVRPILCCTRQEVLAYLDAHRLPHVGDAHHAAQPCRLLAVAFAAERDILNAHLQVADGAVFDGRGMHRAVVETPFVYDAAQRVTDIKVPVDPLGVLGV